MEARQANAVCLTECGTSRRLNRVPPTKNVIQSAAKAIRKWANGIRGMIPRSRLTIAPTAWEKISL